MGHFHSSVVLYDWCMTKLRKEEFVKKSKNVILKKSQLSLVTTKNVEGLLNKAMKDHDNALESLGPSGHIHRCNIEPFRGTFESSKSNLLGDRLLPLTVNITDLWYYDTKVPITEYIPVGNNETMLVDKLCRAGHLKVFPVRQYMYIQFNNKQVMNQNQTV